MTIEQLLDRLHDNAKKLPNQKIASKKINKKY